LTADPRDLVDALREGGHVTVFHEGSVFWLDVKPARSAAELLEVTDAAEVEIRGQPLRIVRPEETIAFKIAFGSPKDEQDALSILTRQDGSLDEARLTDFALRLGVAEKLRQLRERIGR
jgi:DNA-binding transcriptional MocR family regulator